jgi:hypothetical protein
MRGNQIKRFVDDFPSPQPLCVVIGGVYPSRSGFRYALAREATIFDPASFPSRWEGKKYRLSNDLFPLATGAGEGVGDPYSALPLFQHRYSVRDGHPMRIVGAMEAVGKEARTCRLPCSILSL